MYKNQALNTLFDNTRIESNGDRLVLLAGNTHYNDLWIRDAFFGSLGMIAKYIKNEKVEKVEKEQIKINETIKQFLLLLAKNQRKDGLIPLRIGASKIDQMLKMFITNKFCFFKDQAVYYDDKKGSEPTDSCSIFIIIYTLYQKYMKNDTKNDSVNLLNNVMLAHNWNEKNVKNYLIQGKYFNSWYDTFTIDGPDSYSNVLYGYSLKCLEYLNVKTNFEQFMIEFYKNFYNGMFIKIHKDINHLEVVSNCLAIIFLFNKTEKIKISTDVIRYLNSSDNFNLCNVVYPKLPTKYLYLPFVLLGVGGYHNDYRWPWVSCYYAIIHEYANLNNTVILKNIDKCIIKNNDTFCEIVDDNGYYINNCFIKSEKNFTYLCGSYLLVYNFDEKIF